MFKTSASGDNDLIVSEVFTTIAAAFSQRQQLIVKLSRKTMWTRKAIKMIFSIALLFFGAVCQTLSCIREENVHSIFFLSKPSSKLVGHVIRTTFAHSFLTCAQFCSREPRRNSLNYKDNLDMEAKSVC